MVEQFADMLAEVRAYGEGLAIVEQIPTKILPDAVKNTATKVAHRVPSADDREVLAGAMNLTKPQAAVFAALNPGEAILSVEGHPLPVRLRSRRHREVRRPRRGGRRRGGEEAHDRVLPQEPPAAGAAESSRTDPADGRLGLVQGEVHGGVPGLAEDRGDRAARGAGRRGGEEALEEDERR